ncbi:MAG: DUF4282 domain-containing protein [Pseudomonadota bacterium]
MPEFFKRFLTFDKLIATTLIKILYWIGLIAIGLYVIIAMFGGLAMMTQNFMIGLAMFFGAPIGGAVGLLFWRFIMEVYIVIFSIHDRLGEVRDRLGGPAGG